MGHDKAAVRLAGRPLLDHMLAKLAALGLRARVAGLRSPVDGVPAEVFPDRHPGCGPLSGLETAFEHSEAELLLTLGVDLPLLSTAFLAWLLERARMTGALATIPKVLGRPQPLCAVYRRELEPSVRQALLQGDFKVMGVIERAVTDRGEGIDGPGNDLDLFDVETMAAAGAWVSALPAHCEFLNFNSPEDLALGEVLWTRRQLAHLPFPSGKRPQAPML